MSDLVLYNLRDRIGYITLNRPEKRNALSFGFVTEIDRAFATAEADEQCKVIVLEANGEAFCAGADLAYLHQLQNNTDKENLEDSMNLASLLKRIYLSKKVVISKVDGPALAGGCGLATVADFCFASPRSLFGYTEVRIGFIPAIVMVFLLRRVNEKNAREILLGGDTFSAEKALSYGLINGIAESNALGDHVHTFADRICRTASSQSLASVKEMIGRVPSLSLDEGLEYAAGMNVKARKSEDCRKGIAAFLNKEKITW